MFGAIIRRALYAAAILAAAAHAQTADQRNFQQIQNGQIDKVMADLNAACETSMTGAIDYAAFSDADYNNYGFAGVCERALSTLRSKCAADRVTRAHAQEEFRTITCAVGSEADVDVTDAGDITLTVVPRNAMSQEVFASFFEDYMFTEADLARAQAEQQAADAQKAQAASPEFAQAQEDWRALARRYERVSALPDELPDYSFTGTPDARLYQGENLAVLQALADFVRDDLPAIRDGYEAIRARYDAPQASDPQTLGARLAWGMGEIEAGIFAALGWSPDTSQACRMRRECTPEPTLDDLNKPSFYVKQIGYPLDTRLAILQNAEKETFEKVERAIESLEDNLPFDEKFKTQLGDAIAMAEGQLALLARAELTGGDNEAALKAARDKLQAAYDRFDAILYERAAARAWPEPHQRFAGPGDAKALAETALDYLQSKRDDQEFVVAQISGDWFVAKRTITDAPLQYALPVQTVFVTEQSKARGLGVTAEYHLLAQEAANPQQSPPFIGEAGVISVFNGAYIALENVPGKGERVVIRP